jgi:hypothetical protein
VIERERGGGGEGEGGSLWTWVDFGRAEIWSFSTLSENLRDEGKEEEEEERRGGEDYYYMLKGGCGF